MNFPKMYVSITPPEWYWNVIFGGPGPWTISYVNHFFWSDTESAHTCAGHVRDNALYGKKIYCFWLQLFSTFVKQNTEPLWVSKHHIIVIMIYRFTIIWLKLYVTSRTKKLTIRYFATHFFVVVVVVVVCLFVFAFFYYSNFFLNKLLNRPFNSSLYILVLRPFQF